MEACKFEAQNEGLGFRGFGLAFRGLGFSV